MTERDNGSENDSSRSGIRILTPRPDAEALAESKPLKRKALKKRKKVDLEEEVERLDREMREMQASMRSLMCIYQTVRTTGIAEPTQNRPSSSEDPMAFSQMFQAVRSLENEMDRIASIYMSDEQPSVSDHRRLDKLYQNFIDLLLRGNPQLTQSSLTLESLQEDDNLELSNRIDPDEGDGYSPEDEGEMLRSLRMAQQSMETLLMRVARGSAVNGKDLDTLDHWYQVFASFR